MREIKFRAWDEEEKKYWTDPESNGWGEGGASLYITPEGSPVVFGTSDGGKDGLWEHEWNKKGLVLEQFTGLKDANKKEIYEGDLVQWDDSSDNGFRHSGGKHTEVVKYDNGEWRLGEFYGLACVIQNEYASVIGNIHSNSELLKS